MTSNKSIEKNRETRNQITRNVFNMSSMLTPYGACTISRTTNERQTDLHADRYEKDTKKARQTSGQFWQHKKRNGKGNYRSLIIHTNIYTYIHAQNTICVCVYIIAHVCTHVVNSLPLYIHVPIMYSHPIVHIQWYGIILMAWNKSLERQTTREYRDRTMTCTYFIVKAAKVSWSLFARHHWRLSVILCGRSSVVNWNQFRLQQTLVKASLWTHYCVS